MKTVSISGFWDGDIDKLMAQFDMPAFFGIPEDVAAAVFLVFEREFISLSDLGTKVGKFMTFVRDSLDKHVPDWRQRYGS